MEWLPWHAWLGGRLGWKSITETDSCFSRFAGEIPSRLLLPHQECHSNRRECQLLIVDHRLCTKTNTNKWKRCTAQIPAGVLKHTSDTLCREHASLIHQHNHSEIYRHTCIRSITVTHMHTWGKLCPINCCNHYSTYVANLSLAISIMVGWWSTDRDRTKPRRSHDKSTKPSQPQTHRINVSTLTNPASHSASINTYRHDKY